MYVQVLPSYEELHKIAFLWTDDELSYLQGSPLYTSIRTLQYELFQDFDKLQNLKLGFGISLDEFYWAMAIVQSRGAVMVSSRISCELRNAVICYASENHVKAFFSKFYCCRSVAVVESLN